MIIDGKKIAEEILQELANKPKPDKFFAVFSVSPSIATKKFLDQKQKMAESLGVDFRIYEFKESITQDDLRKEVLKIVSGNTCGGAIVQLPLPESIDAQYVLNVIPREKDVDVLGERALGAFYVGRNKILPPAVETTKKILSSLNLNLPDLNCAVVGQGRLVGKPISNWLNGKCKNLFLLDKGSDFSILKNADVVVCGAGSPGIVTPEMLKRGAIVIDFGYGEKDGHVMGDFDPQNSNMDISYTPTPGGTGPILVSNLFENFYTLSISQKPTKKKPLFYKG